MNKKETYEITITDKLQHLRLPELENAIWSRIEKQLDMDLPTDDPGNDPGNGSPSGGGSFPFSYAILIFTVAVVTAFFIFKNNRKDSGTTQPDTATETPAVSSSQGEMPGDGKKANQNKNFSILPVDSPSPVITISNDEDSISAFPLSNIPSADSSQKAVTVSPLPAHADSTLPKPKTRGVKGISDSDYRIAPVKKDST